MRKPIYLVLGLAACTSQPKTTPLAQLGTTQVEVVTNGKINIELHVDETQGCPTLDEHVMAMFDGAPMQVSRGGYDTNASGCYPIAFWFNDTPLATVNGFEKSANASELVVVDKSATWTVDTVPLFANDFLDDTQNSQIIWPEVSSIASAEISPGTPTQITGNVISYPVGLQITWVSALSHPTPTRCDGPGVCTVSLQGQRDFLAKP
jgi:hypothetical protein